MGIFSSSTDKIRINNAHLETMERIRSENDIKQRQLLIEEKAKEFDLEKYKLEIQRLANLDKQNYDLEVKRILARQREKDQLHEREKIRMDNEYKNKQKELSNNELKIRNTHEEEMLKEKNRNDNENTRIKLNHIIEKKKLKTKNSI